MLVYGGKYSRTNSVGLYSAANGLAAEASLISGLNGPWGIIFCPNGYLYVSNSTSGTIGEYLADGMHSECFFDQGCLILRILRLIRIIIIHCSTTIGGYMLNGTIINSSFITGLQGPSSLAFYPGASGHLYVSNDGSNAIGEYLIDGTPVNPTWITGLHKPRV